MRTFFLCGMCIVMLLLAACSSTPEAGAVLKGSIDMSNASSAGISLKVSQDGASIESISLSFNDLACEGFSAGSYSTMTTLKVPIEKGAFTIKGEFGEISGKFTSGTSAKGTADFAFFNGQAECGSGKWSASSN